MTSFIVCDQRVPIRTPNYFYDIPALSETTSAAAAHLDETESTQSADPSPSDSEAGLAGLEAILRYYAEHTEALRIAYHNRLQITAARQEYLAQNPPEEGNKIINFRPLLASEKKSLRSTVSGQDRSFTAQESSITSYKKRRPSMIENIMKHTSQAPCLRASV